MTRKMANMYLTAEGLPIDPTNTAMYATMHQNMRIVITVCRIYDDSRTSLLGK